LKAKRLNAAGFADYESHFPRYWNFWLLMVSFRRSVILSAGQSDLDAIEFGMFSLSNRTVMALLCVAIIVLSCVVIEGLNYVMEMYAMSLPDPLLKRVGWKPR
jgi:hypothetical protein